MLFGIYEDTFLGIASVLLLRFRCDQRELLNPLTAAACLLFLTPFVSIYTGQTTGWIYWAFVATALVTTYIVRFRKRSRRVIDYFKLLAILVFLLNPLIFYGWSPFNPDDYVPLIITEITPVIIAFIYFYDRIVLKPENMKRKFVVILLVQSVAILMFLVFGLYQQTIAEATRMHEMDCATRLNAAEEQLADCKE